MLLCFNELNSESFFDNIFFFVIFLLIFLIFLQNDQTQKKSLKITNSVSQTNTIEQVTIFLFLVYIFLSLLRLKFF
jgi:hypothetical protein